MGLYSEEELLPISGLQHLAFCERQWALIHVEQQWRENQRTAEGRIIHERVHDPFYKPHKPGWKVVRSMQLQSLRLGLFGEADVVEFFIRKTSQEPGDVGELSSPRPVEYKRGKSKKGDYDRIQLCAQAMCLEEMMNCHIDEGDLYYAETRRREVVRLDDELRSVVTKLSEKMHRLYREGITPRPDKKLSVCRTCSMVNICLPKIRSQASGESYWREVLETVAPMDD